MLRLHRALRRAGEEIAQEGGRRLQQRNEQQVVGLLFDAYCLSLAYHVEDDDGASHAVRGAGGDNVLYASERIVDTSLIVLILLKVMLLPAAGGRFKVQQDLLTRKRRTSGEDGEVRLVKA